VTELNGVRHFAFCRVMHSPNIIDMGGMDNVGGTNSSVVAMGAGLVGQSTIKKVETCNDDEVTLFSFPKDSFSWLARKWFNAGSLFNRKFDEIRVRESMDIGKKQSLDVYYRGKQIETVDSDGVALVADNVVPNDELILRDPLQLLTSYTGFRQVHRVGNVLMTKYPASLCYGHGWISSVLIYWKHRVGFE
jgi:hypothetical protein